jgi:hypothetical protein
VQARLLGGEHRRELASARGEIRQGAGGRRARRAHRRLDEGGVLGKDPGVEAVGLAEHPERAGKVPNAVRRDHHDGHGRRMQRVDERALPAAGGLHVASTTTRAGASVLSRATRRRRPAGVCGRRAWRPLGCTCTSSVAFDTSTPTKRAGCAARAAGTAGERLGMGGTSGTTTAGCGEWHAGTRPCGCELAAAGQRVRRLGRLYEVAMPASGGAATVFHVSGLAERAMALAAYRSPVLPVRCARRSDGASASYMALQLAAPRAHHGYSGSALVLGSAPPRALSFERRS